MRWREMILADSTEARKIALAKLLPYQREDFIGMFKELKGLPPPSVFSTDPRSTSSSAATRMPLQQDLAKKMGVPVEKIKQRVKELHESTRCWVSVVAGWALGIRRSSEMQARAVFEAAAEVQKQGIKVKPEIMIPLVGFKKELDLQIDLVNQVAKQVMAEKKVKLTYMTGTMIEVPRGALTADEIAKTAEFFSFGTNDLTQTCLGMSRDDSGSFLPQYSELEIVKKNPFASIDQEGVGQLMKMAVEKGRSTRPDIKLGICGAARWRSGERQVLSPDWPELRKLLALPRAGSPPGRRASRAGRSCRRPPRSRPRSSHPSCLAGIDIQAAPLARGGFF